jgi:protein subunit release factor B
MKKSLKNIMVEIKKHNNCFQLTIKSVTFFAKQKNAPFFMSAEAGVIRKRPSTPR